jgi:hypothetical protein
MKVNRVTGFFIAGFALLLLVALYGLAFAVKGAPDAVRLPILAIAGVILLLGALAVVSVTFSLFELSDKTQALGLPEGSVRAVIALSLIVLFAILVVYLYGTLSNSPADAPNVDFAKQLLVLVGTLVTSVSSFYFGARAAVSGVVDVSRPAPEIRGIDPPRLTAGGTYPLEVKGDRLDLVKEVKIVSGANQIVASDVVSNASTVRCQLAVPADATGIWDVIVTDGSGKTSTLPGVLTITAVSGEAPPPTPG